MRLLGPDQQREMVRNQILQVEQQLYGRQLDLRKWTALDLGAVEKAGANSIYIEQKKNEREQQVSGARGDIAFLEQVIRTLTLELDALESETPAESA